jgi:3-dehydroquinate synthase
MMCRVSHEERRISLRLAGQDGYDILVRPGLLADVGPWLSAHAKTTKAALISDSAVLPLHGPPVVQSLKSVGIHTIVVELPQGEDHKTLGDLLPVFDRILGSQIERSTPILALGGGVVGDMAGFVAATILRGVPFVQIPTSLLAMVDASVGGKTGVNSAAGKNLIGAFHQPIGVLIDPLTLQTLPPAELRNGLAECIKHDIIRDAVSFGRLEANVQKAHALDMEYLTDLIAHNVAIKARVVEADPLERGQRAHLNFGHTFGHAIETVSHHRYSHGQCVALGMTAACFVADKLRMISEIERRHVVHVISKAGLPTGGLTLPAAEIVKAMAFDKKVANGRLRLVLPQGIGQAVVREDVPADLVMAAVESLRGE